MTLTVTDLAKRYGGNWVLRNVSFDAPKGCVTGIFGSKGAGKSSLLRMLAGLEERTGGSFVLNGRTPGPDNAHDGIAYIPTMPASPFFQRAFGAKQYNTVDVANRQADAVDTAIEGTDEVLLLDDPFCFFDADARDAYTEKVRKAAHDGGKTVVVASGNFEDILRLCDRVVVMADGQVAQTGTPEEVYDTPENSTVARMTGRHNLIEARRLTSTKAELPEFQTILGGHRLFAKKTVKSDLGAINQNVRLSIRPEQISLSFGAAFPEDNLIKANISGIRFMGPVTLVELDAGGLPIEAYVTRLVGLNVGDECMVGLPPDRLRILKY